MYRSLSLLLLGFLLTTVSSMAQVDNYSLKFIDKGTVSFGIVPELNGLSTFTIQFWMCPAEWTEGATLYSRGDSFAARMGSAGELMFIVGTDSVSVTSSEIVVGKWVHFSMISDMPIRNNTYILVSVAEYSYLSIIIKTLKP